MNVKSAFGLVIGFFLLVSSVLAQQPNVKTQQNFIDTILYYRYLNPDSAVLFVKQGIDLAKKQKNDSFLAAMLIQQGILDDNAMASVDSRTSYLEAERIYRKINDSVGLAATLIRLGEVERRKDAFNRSYPYLLNALEISSKINDKQGIIEANLTLGKLYNAQKKYKEAIAYLEKAEALASKEPLNHLLFSIYIYFGQVYSSLEEYDKAIAYVNKGLAKVDLIRGGGGHKLNLLRTLGFAYYYKGDSAKGESILVDALKLAKTVKNRMRELHILLDLAEVNEMTKPLVALSYYKQALPIAAQFQMTSRQAFVLNKMSNLYKRNGSLNAALETLNEAYRLTKEFHEKRTVRQINDLEAAYQLERTKSEVNALTILNNEQIASKRIWLVTTILLAIVGLIIIYFTYRSQRLNSLLQQSNRQLVESNDVKDKLFSIIAHDIRAPLASFISVLELIREREIDQDDYDRSILKLIDNSQNSLNVIDKLLKWGENQLKGVRLNKTVFDPKLNILRIVDFLNDSAEKKQILIHLSLTSKNQLEADSDHFDFIIRNLIANAIKFTKVGGKIEISSCDDAQGMTVFEVADDGVGIPASRIDSVFELTSESTKGTSSEVGTGLGLMLCKEFARANGGDISVSSEANKGSKFRLSLTSVINEMV